MLSHEIAAFIRVGDKGRWHRIAPSEECAAARRAGAHLTGDAAHAGLMVLIACPSGARRVVFHSDG